MMVKKSSLNYHTDFVVIMSKKRKQRLKKLSMLNIQKREVSEFGLCKKSDFLNFSDHLDVTNGTPSC